MILTCLRGFLEKWENDLKRIQKIEIFVTSFNFLKSQYENFSPFELQKYENRNLKNSCVYNFGVKKYWTYFSICFHNW